MFVDLSMTTKLGLSSRYQLHLQENIGQVAPYSLSKTRSHRKHRWRKGPVRCMKPLDLVIADTLMQFCSKVFIVHICKSYVIFLMLGILALTGRPVVRTCCQMEVRPTEKRLIPSTQKRRNFL